MSASKSPASGSRFGRRSSVKGWGMGVVIDFAVRAAAPAARDRGRSGEGAQIVILPVIRIERYDEDPYGCAGPDGGATQLRRRRRRLSRA